MDIISVWSDPIFFITVPRYNRTLDWLVNFIMLSVGNQSMQLYISAFEFKSYHVLIIHKSIRFKNTFLQKKKKKKNEEVNADDFDAFSAVLI